MENEANKGLEQKTIAGVYQIFDVHMPDIVGDYDVPDGIREWEWVKDNASFNHKNNGESGIWEFMVNIDMAELFNDIPELLKPVIDDALEKGYSYILFYQGT